MARDMLTTERSAPTNTEVLKKAYDLIKRRPHWCRDVHARPKDGGKSVPFNSPDAVRFCAMGAILRSENDLGRPIGTTIRPHSRLAERIRFVNDRLGHLMTLILLRFMIRFGR
jgi:hypothetical protein